ncbi:Uncharacterized protein LW94_6370 [Fusarium fujikuroi]|nr:Uncharacterized protein LW94_6370 [Fusarium fujikuroi]
MADLTIYTVGWICAIEAELNAAVLFLDDEHDPPEDLPVHDNNSYILGRIGKHNVVIAALPFGEYGLTSAATVARDMVRSFPNVRIGLMVGIGGGAPTSLNDVRLGDVVVGSPGPSTGGIFQYDYGKTIQESNFVITRHLNQPPQFLLTALSSIKGQYMRRGHNLENAIDEALANNPIELPGYHKPSYNSDRLFVTAYKHARDGEDCSVSCTDSSKLVYRGERNQSGPKVHFGTIASANQLMKDATIRDRLSAERNVLCFEMEAAGLANHFPCLIIRGICDYSDTHKNKEWQGYAAMVAAAFAKDLLHKIAPNKVEAEKKLKDVIETVSDKVDAISATINHTYGYMQNDQARERYNTILKWMAAPDISINLNKALDTRQEGSGKSLIKAEVYRTWKSQANSFLWLSGIPGSGKTILSSTVIEDLQSSLRHHAVIYYYFDFSDGQKQTFENCLRSLICQLYGKFENIRRFLNVLHDTCTNGQEQPNMNALQAVFAEMAQSIGELWIVIDALDECSADERSARVLPWVKGISHSEQFNTHILVTSRPELDIEKGITAWGRSKYATLVANKLIAEDIYAYVKAKVRDPQSKLMERWKQRDDILNKLRMLEDCLDSRRLYEKLNLLPTTLNGTYDRILKDIARHPHMKDGIRVLQMLMFSRSRLTLEQAVDAIAVDTERRPYFEMENRMPDPLDLLSCLSGLVNTVKHGGELVLQLAHFSVKEYLTSEQLPTEFRKPLQEIVARTSIAETCLAYRLDLRRNIECCADLSPRLRELAPLKRQRELQHQISTSGWLGTLDQPDALVEAAGLGLACPITALLERNTDNEVRGRALEAASRNGHKKIVRLLLENGAQINMHDKHYGTPLISALMGGQIGVAQLLLDSGADINAQAGTFGTALQTASSSGDLHCVQTLLDYHVDVNVLGGNFGSALQAACYNRHESVTRMLLEAGADPNIWGYGDYLKIKSGSALYIASIKGCPDIVQLLVDYGADVNALGGLDGTALQVAAMLGHEEVVEVLLGCDNIDLDARGGYHGTALRAALYAKHQSIVDSLIEHGAQMDVDSLSD